MRTLLALAAVALFAAVGQGGEKPLAWPQFRGPAGSSRR